jgi:4-amino-4-deoxy-L-arabinose transferase-like glycosyltransferase
VAARFQWLYHAVLERRSTAVLAVCVALTLVGGAVACAALGNRIRFYDEREYLAIGRHIADDGAVQIYDGTPTAYRTPGYPLVLAVPRLLGLGHGPARFANFVFLALTIAAAYALAHALAGRAAGALAAVLTAAYPFFPYTASTFYPQTMAGLLVVLTLLVLAHALRAEGRARPALAAGAGLSAGALALVVPTFAYVAPLTLVWIGIAHRGALLRAGLPFLVGALLLPAAWTIRNFAVFDQFVPLAASSGFNLLVGNHPGVSADGRYDRAYMQPLKLAAKARGLDEIQTDDFYDGIARHWISHHKKRALTLYLGKLVNNFSWGNTLATPGQDSGIKSLLGAVVYLPLLGLLGLRLALARRHRLLPIEWLMVAIMAANALLLAVYATRVRYRLPVDTLMIVIVAVFLAGAAQRWTNSRRAEPVAPLP